MYEVNGTALVTGGSRGIGRASALRLARAGADVAITYIENESAANKTAEEIRALGRRALVVQADALDVDANVAAVRATVEELGALRTLVSNAANGSFGTIDELTVEQWDATMAMHARALFVLAKEATGAIESAGGGSIVAISSLGANRVFGAYGAFGTSKAAIEQLVRYLAVEYGPAGIRANCVSGGIVLTDLFKSIPGWEDIAAAGAERSPLRTVLDPEDVADAVAFFASDGASRITGQTLTVDAGYLLPG
jgi:enoyl-[acyl-carrier protein] reductase III